MKEINTFISDSLQKRILDNSYRTLKPENSLIDFCSNDYLGFSRSEELKNLFQTELKKQPEYHLGSGGSRLLAGNHSFTEQLEHQIAIFHDSESALIYNSGFDANIGLFSSLPQRGDTIISDEFIHASIIDGIRLSHANREVFRHNDLNNLEQKLKLAKGRIYVVVESVYSMDGDEAPLQDILNLADKYNAAVIVDEAHAIGIFGASGKGLVYDLGLSTRVFSRIITFGKALGTHGSAILGSSQLRSYLINFSRSLIYTTAAPFLNHLLIKCAYTYLKSMDHQSEIRKRIDYFTKQVSPNLKLLKSHSAIQIIVIPGNDKAREAAQLLQKNGFDIRAILSPSVAKGSERLRICLHNHNSFEQIKNLCELLNHI